MDVKCMGALLLHDGAACARVECMHDMQEGRRGIQVQDLAGYVI